jgi:hypothetical protein
MLYLKGVNEILPYAFDVSRPFWAKFSIEYLVMLLSTWSSLKIGVIKAILSLRA